MGLFSKDFIESPTMYQASTGGTVLVLGSPPYDKDHEKDGDDAVDFRKNGMSEDEDDVLRRPTMYQIENKKGDNYCFNWCCGMLADGSFQ